MRLFRLCLVLLIACGLLACGGGRRRDAPRRKLVILGFDGMDPKLLQRFMREGQLPHLASLAQKGGVYPLETTVSADSASAWATFATGVNAAKHNIFGAGMRDPRTHLPDASLVRVRPPRFWFNYVPVTKATITSRRTGASFWARAGHGGVRTSILTVPLTYPPEHVENGELLSGLPLPDLRNGAGTYQYFATDGGNGRTASGGILKRLTFEHGVARTQLVGPRHPIVSRDASKQATGDDLLLPVTMHWNRGAPEPSVTIALPGHQVRLRSGEWSKWIPIEFRVNLLVRLRGMAQFFLSDVSEHVHLYMSPINWLPQAPPLPMSSPASFSADLHERLGPYRTLGWAEATAPLDEGWIDEQAFMDDSYRAFDDRAQTILSRIDDRKWDLLVGVIETPDRVQHMMWRFTDPLHPMYDAALAARHGDSIARLYRRCDQFVGQALERLDPAAAVMIVSDHGFHSWRRTVTLNTWLVDHGYMTLTTPVARPFRGRSELVDWSRTRAYAMGSGQVYLNQRGREAQGIVGPEAAAALIAELRGALRALRDPDTNAPIVRAVYPGREVYRGPYLGSAPDLQVATHDGYRVSDEEEHARRDSFVRDNRRKWSGDHAGFDYLDTPGVLLTNLRIASDRPRLVDIAPSVLRHFGLTLPTDLDGRPLF